MRFARLLSAAFTASAIFASAGCAASGPPPVSGQVQAYYEQHQTLAAQAPATAPPATIPAALLKPGTKAVFFGDSWTAGYSATPPTGGFAPTAGNALGWDFAVDGVGGTGFIHAGDQKKYADRFAAKAPDPSVQILILQGGINDLGEDLGKLEDAINKTLDAAAAAYPSAKIVLMAPGSIDIPATPELRTISNTIRNVSVKRGVPLVSPIDEYWITSSNHEQFIDMKTYHPNTEGHRYLGGKLVDSLRGLAV